MFSHTISGSKDLERSKRFYDAIFTPLGIECVEGDVSSGWLGYRRGPWAHADGTRNPSFWLTAPVNGQPASSGNGTNIGFEAFTREAVDAAFAAGLAHGGTSEGAPGLRDYHPHFYGCYLRDPDGNKICIVCHRAP